MMRHDQQKRRKVNFSVLALCGGGIRGIIPAYLADRLKLEKAKFGLIAGTSTGSIIAAAIACGIPAKRILNLYTTKGRKIFPPFWRRIPSWVGRTFSEGISKPFYSSKALHEELKSNFNGTRLGDITDTRLMIPAWDVKRSQPKYFKSYDEKDKHYYLHDVVLASCSAPVYFPAHTFDGMTLIDGGVAGVNNPSVAAIIEAKKFVGESMNIKCLCLGTGDVIGEYDSKYYGPTQWVTHLVQLLLAGPEKSVIYQARRLLNGDYQYLNVPIPNDNGGMDDASEDNIKALLNISATYAETLPKEYKTH